MEIHTLGTGTAIPINQHSPSGLIVKAGSECLLFDIGPGTLGRLQLANVRYDQISQLLISHLHPDHTLDLATLMLIFNYAPGAERKTPFQISACQGFDDFFKRMVDLYPEIEPVSFELQTRSVFREEFSIGSLKIKCAPTGHTPESVAYRVEDGSHSMVYSGDAAPQGELAQLAKNADLLVSECSFPAGWQTEDHLTAETLGIIAQQAEVKTLVVVHSYPPALAVDLAAQIRSYYQGQVQLAFDGMQISL